jgi:dethiobiotin synthetase
MAGLAAHFGLPLVIAARAALGTINHTWLTLEAARARGLRVLGVAISHTEPEHSDADRQNLRRLLEDLPVPLLGELSHGGNELAPPLDLKALLAASG